MSPAGDTRTRGMNCPRCAGSLGSGADLEQLLCSYCGHGFVHRSDRGVAAYAPVGRIGRQRALRVLREALANAGVRGHAVESTQLIYLPFWDLEAKLVGWQRYRRRAPTRSYQVDDTVYTESAHLEMEEESYGRDVVSSQPACDVRPFGLVGVADRVRTLKLRPFHLDGLREGERACAVVTPRTAVLRAARLYHSARFMPQDARMPRQRFSLIRPRLRVIYYPVWRLRYRAGGLFHEAIIDGIRARVLQGSYPAHLRGSLRSWLAAGGAGGALAGVHPFLMPLGLAGWSLMRMTRDGVRGRLGEMATWFNRQIGGGRLVVRDLEP